MCVRSHEMAVVFWHKWQFQFSAEAISGVGALFFFFILDCVKLEKKYKLNIWKYNHKQLNRGAIYPLYPIFFVSSRADT